MILTMFLRREVFLISVQFSCSTGIVIFTCYIGVSCCCNQRPEMCGINDSQCIHIGRGYYRQGERTVPKNKLGKNQSQTQRTDDS